MGIQYSFSQTPTLYSEISHAIHAKTPTDAYLSVYNWRFVCTTSILGAVM